MMMGWNKDNVVKYVSMEIKDKSTYILTHWYFFKYEETYIMGLLKKKLMSKNDKLFDKRHQMPYYF